MLLYRPRLNCITCSIDFRDEGLVPICRTERGCQVEKWEQDFEVVKKAEAFIRFKRLSAIKGYEHRAVEFLDNAGVTDLDLIMMLEDRFDKFIKAKQKEQEAIQGAKKGGSRKHRRRNI